MKEDEVGGGNTGEYMDSVGQLYDHHGLDLDGQKIWKRILNKKMGVCELDSSGLSVSVKYYIILYYIILYIILYYILYYIYYIILGISAGLLLTCDEP
jgi:hypothetical protein